MIPFSLAMVMLVVGLPIAGAAVLYWLREHVFPTKPYWVGLAPNVPRRHLEGLRSWDRRHADSMRRLHDAEHAIIESPDATWSQVSARGSSVSLPANHPLTLRALCARYPDGPSYEELAQIAYIEPKETTMGLTTETGIATASENTPAAAADLVQTNEMTPELVVPQEPILKFFEYEHLPPAVQNVSADFCRLAHAIVHNLPRSAERTVALRKLLEGKDAAVRAALP